ncbi:choline kinase family protein [Tabrizicola sp. J26]|uniref:phosphotransferase n=1 Tax=Alitabrizicola rongguiensis TaxID=2909234 RepID=UPI001F1D128A|nr:phosphotransferase [Tabrizicola rongguiensis]MCF1708851.1 choline kinase family protein [Tabrizicola rongguiensis]
MDALDRIRDLPIWHGRIIAEPLGGGITNLNFRVQDSEGIYVVRVGADIGVHQIMRFNELAASRAAHAAGISPRVVHAETGILVIDWIEGKTLTAADVRAEGMLPRVVDLVARAHRDIPNYIRGPVLSFWVFHVIRDYAGTLRYTRHELDLAGYLAACARLEEAVGRVEIVFGHNDLLPANFIDDGKRLWLIDWDYAGFNSPLFDLGGLAANNALSHAQEEAMLAQYFGKPADADLWRRYRAMKAAAALREAMWSMVQETHSDLPVDYLAYTDNALAAYRLALTEFEQS